MPAAVDIDQAGNAARPAQRTAINRRAAAADCGTRCVRHKQSAGIYNRAPCETVGRAKTQCAAAALG